jgi:hypothetical protein
VETVLKRFAAHPETLFDKLNGLMHSWAGSGVAATTAEIEAKPAEATSAPVVASPPSTAAATTPIAAGNLVGQLSEALAQALESLLSALPELATATPSLVQQVRDIDPEQMAEKQPAILIGGIARGDKTKSTTADPTAVLLVNIKMVEDDEWLRAGRHPQEIIANPSTSAASPCRRGLLMRSSSRPAKADRLNATQLVPLIGSGRITVAPATAEGRESGKIKIRIWDLGRR